MNAPKTATSSTHRVDEGVPHGHSTPGSRRSTTRKVDQQQGRTYASVIPEPTQAFVLVVCGTGRCLCTEQSYRY